MIWYNTFLRELCLDASPYTFHLAPESTRILTFISILTDVNECTLQSDDCSEQASCSNTPGSYNCTCKEGFSGDGRTCAGIILQTNIKLQTNFKSESLFLERIGMVGECPRALVKHKDRNCSNSSWSKLSTLCVSYMIVMHMPDLV